MFLKPSDSAAFKTPIGKKIEQATHKDLVTTDWSVNLDICDLINSTPDGPQQAVKAIRARLQQKEDKQIGNSLILLDTLIKNCGRRLHLLVATRDFMCDLIRLVSPRDPTSQEVKDRALTLIERCTDAFKHDKDLAAVGEAYQYLKTQHVQFPAQDLDDMVAIHTPRASHSVIDPPIPHRTQNAIVRPPPVATPVVVTSNTPVVISTQPIQQPLPTHHPSGISHNDLMRLNKELLVVRGNDAVMNDILADLHGNSNPVADEVQLLRDLHVTCKEMYKRMIELLELVEEEGLVCQLLDLIDKLNNTFLRYERYERNLVLSAPADQHGTPTPLAAPRAVPPLAAPAVPPLGVPAVPQSAGEATNIYAVPRSDIEELLSLEHPTYNGSQAPEEALYADPTSQYPTSAVGVNPFQEFLDAPVTRLPPSAAGAEDSENIYTTSPAKVAPSSASSNTLDAPDNTLSSHADNLTITDSFDMFAQSRSSTLNERAQLSSCEAAYDAAHDVPQTSSLASALQSRPAVSDDWLKDLNSVEGSSQHTMSNDEFDQFLNAHAPAPPTTALNKPSKQRKDDDEDLFAL